MRIYDKRFQYTLPLYYLLIVDKIEMDIRYGHI